MYCCLQLGWISARGCGAVGVDALVSISTTMASRSSDMQRQQSPEVANARELQRLWFATWVYCVGNTVTSDK